MAPSRAFRRKLPPLILTAGCVLVLGCPAVPVVVPAAILPGAVGEEQRTRQGAPAEGRVSSQQTFQVIEGTIVVPAALTGGADRLVGSRLDDLEAGAAQQATASPQAPAFRVMQAAQATPTPDPDADKPVEKALISVRSTEFKTIPELPSNYSLQDGSFIFENVPARIAFFLEAQIETPTASYQMLGLTRTEEVGKVTKVTIDAASTMTARELMRMWQISNYQLNFQNLDPRDFNPLLKRLRRYLAKGFPKDIAFDPTKVGFPEGGWSFNADKKDSALVALDKLCARDDLINKEVDRLYLAVNASITRVRDASRVVIGRPPTLMGPPPTPKPTPVPATPTPKPQLPKRTATGSVVAPAFPVTVKFKPLFERDPDGAEASTRTDATGKWSVQLQVGTDGDAHYSVVRVNADGTETVLGSFRLMQDNQAAGNFTGSGASPTPAPR